MVTPRTLPPPCGSRKTSFRRSGPRSLLDGPGVVDPVALVEAAIKKPIWGCQMCGQCVLHSTGMTCPMNCPKTLRNGPCGGVRPNGHCEVKPEMRCVWLKGFERASHMPGIPQAWRDEYDHTCPP